MYQDLIYEDQVFDKRDRTLGSCQRPLALVSRQLMLDGSCLRSPQRRLGEQALRFPAELGQDLRNHSCRELIREPFLQTVALKDHVAEVHTQ
jgi:hypothetical protein